MAKSKRSVYLFVGGLVSALVLLTVAGRLLPVVDTIARLQQAVMQWGAWGAFSYPILFALCNLLLLPGGVLSVGAGFFFGLWWGFLVVIVGNTIGAAGAFLLTRRIGRHWFRARLSQHPVLKTLEPALEREGWKIIFLTQLHPLFPTSLINYFCGLTRIRFTTYLVWVTIGRAPGLFLYTYLGTLGQYGLNIARGRTHPKLIEYWLWGGAFVLGAALLLVVARVGSQTITHASKT